MDYRKAGEVRARGLELRELEGRELQFLYPRHNYEGVAVRLEQRRLRVDSVRDLMAEPLDPLTKALDPLLKRGQLLLKGLDLDKNAERNFYFESMVDVTVKDFVEPAGEAPRESGEHVVIIMPKPEGWEPTSPTDLPPEIELHKEPTRRCAQLCAQGFNTGELEKPSGYWAVG